MWALAAFVALIVLCVVLVDAKRRRRPAPQTTRMAILAVVAITSLAIGVDALTRISTERGDLYRIRATVVDPTNVPASDIRIWSNVGGEWTEASGSWELIVPSGSLPRGRVLVVRAQRESTGELAVDSLSLGNDKVPTLTLQLQAAPNSVVRGMVLDPGGQGVAGAVVMVEGYGSEAVETDGTGSFVLAAHAPEGRPVVVRAEKAGLGVVRLYHPAGREPVLLRLQR
jgi:hypothetical protein